MLLFDQVNLVVWYLRDTLFSKDIKATETFEWGITKYAPIQNMSDKC